MDDMAKKRFDDRMQKKVDKPRPEEKDFPLTTKMKVEMEREVLLNQRCPQCKHMNKPEHHMIFTMRFDLLGESVPLIVWICNQCGMLFAPRWGRRVIQEATDAQLKLHGKVEIDG
jgi:rubrerythrin